MDLSWRDAYTTLLALLGGTVVFAKLQEYSWWLIGSWRGAVAVLGVIGLAMLAVRLSELADLNNWLNFGESVLWLAAAALAITGLFVASEAIFISLAIVLGVVWLESIVRHAWHSTHHPTMPYVAAH